jgi:hypothetical protein
MKRVEQRGQLVLDEGDFYEVENSLGLHYIPFVGEAGQSDPRRVLLDHFAVGELDYGETNCDQYFVAFESLTEAKADLVSRKESETSEDDEMCARCERRPSTKGDFCAKCIETMEGII